MDRFERLSDNDGVPMDRSVTRRASRPTGSRMGSKSGGTSTRVAAELIRGVGGASRARSDAQVAELRRLVRAEIRRREAVEGALKSSERHYGQLLLKSRRMQDQLRRLSHELLAAHEDERRRISRELHHQIAQTLTAINVRLAFLKQQASRSTKNLTITIASAQRLLERSMNTVHLFARELRPPMLDDLGLIPALHAYMKAFTKRTHLLVRFKAFAGVEQLGIDKRTVLYRVSEEALTNVAKHANASVVKVSISRIGNTVRLEIHDNGKSFQVQRVLSVVKPGRLGLVGMRERVEMVGGGFTIDSIPGKGTTVRAEIPRDERKRK